MFAILNNTIYLTRGDTAALAPADTASLSSGEYIYDVDIKLANGDVHTIISADGDNPGRLVLGVNV